MLQHQFLFTRTLQKYLRGLVSVNRRNTYTLHKLMNDGTYLIGFHERRQETEKIIQMSNANGRSKADHHFDLVVDSRILSGAHEEYAATERVAEISGQFLLSCYVQHVIDAGRDIVLAHFVPSNQIEY